MRRQGVGLEIVNASLRWARMRGARTAWLRSKAATSARSGALRKFGFRDAYRYATGVQAAETIESGKQEILLVAACALVDSDGRILLAQRPEGKSLAGLWEFPGGKVEPGETPEETLIRELDEELGIRTKVACLAPLTFASHTYDTIPSADAALCLPALRRHCPWPGRAGGEMGAPEGAARLSDAARR